MKLIREHVPSISEPDLERAALQGILTEFQTRVELVSSDLPERTAKTSLITTNSVYEDHFAYLRIRSVSGDLAQQLSGAFETLLNEEDVRGLVLDLRYAGGRDYAAALNTASLFLDEPRQLLDWGQGFENAIDTDDRIRVSSIALINGETRGSAEALAAMFREAGIGLLIGSNTAGQAHVFQEIPMSTGAKLRVAKDSIRVGDGVTLSKSGVAPDIDAHVSPEDEIAYFKDPFSRPRARGGQENRPSRTIDRLNEAELVRRQLQSQEANPDLTRPNTRPVPARPTLFDPALARAIDVLKGLDIVEQFNKSPNSR